MRATVRRLSLTLLGASGLFALVCFAYVILHLRGFEWQPLLGFAGWRGAAFVAFLVAGLVVLTWSCIAGALWPRKRAAAVVAGKWTFLTAWLIAGLWFADWVFMDPPFSVRLSEWWKGPEAELNAERRTIAAAVAKARTEGSIAALVSPGQHADEERLAIILARVEVNRPAVFARTPIGAVIRKYADQYGVSPVLLLDWTYIDSFYGEAPAGPMPMFAGGLNPETFRDLVQAHLPPWLIESRVRVALIEGPWFEYLFPEPFANKLRYAVQKATYDIAISPYMNSVFSDTFLILEEYKAEFPEIFERSADDPLAQSFLALENDALLKPYDAPYQHAARDSEYYDRHRNDLMTFARAAVYRLTADFEFATKVQALVARYYADQYARRIGAARWAELSERQQTSLLVMLRDVYTPNIGKLSYNLYMVPELNCTPIDFMAGEVNSDFDAVRRADRTWRPRHSERLWGSTGLMLRVLSEVWDVTSGTPLPGVVSPDTVADSLRVVTRNNESRMQQ